jgi:YVTN family beta-propeller protein
MKFHSMRRAAFGLAAAALFGVGAQARAAAPNYHLDKTVVLGGEGGWDYLAVDAASRRLYLSHGTRVQVLDADTLKTVGEIPKTDGVHGVAVASDLGRGFASAGKADQVVIFDLKTLKTLGTVKTGKNPDAILYEPSTHRVFAFDGKSQDTTVIDAASGTVVGTIPLGGRPEFAATDGAGTVYVNIEDKNELVALDANALTVKSRWPLAPCEEPSGLAIDVAGKTLFAVCGNKLMAIVDATTGKIVATPAIGDHADAAAFDAETGLAFSSNGEGTLTVVARGDDGKYAVAQTVKTQKGAKTMALDPKTGRIFLDTAEFGAAPAATKEQPHPRPSVVPGTFKLLVFAK